MIRLVCRYSKFIKLPNKLNVFQNNIDTYILCEKCKFLYKIKFNHKSMLKYINYIDKTIL